MRVPAPYAIFVLEQLSRAQNRLRIFGRTRRASTEEPHEPEGEGRCVPASSPSSQKATAMGLDEGRDSGVHIDQRGTRSAVKGVARGGEAGWGMRVHHEEGLAM
jgi:hypothetical protein